MNIITGNKFKNLCDFVLDENGFIKTNKDNEIKIHFSIIKKINMCYYIE